MACVESITPMNVDSEMEEGEIVDDLSDISSEEEFLLRQRLEVLENYNNVLERKKAKRTSIGPGTKHKKGDPLSYDLSEISATELEEYCSSPYKNIKVQKYQKIHHRQKRKKEESNVSNKHKVKEHKKKNTRPKKKIEVKVISESSDESDDEYRNRRKKLAEAVVVYKSNNDKTSLSDRLQKMLCGVNPEPVKLVFRENKSDTHTIAAKTEDTHNCPILPQNRLNHILNSEIQDTIEDPKTPYEIIDICTDEESKAEKTPVDTVDGVIKENEHERDIKKILDRDKLSDKDSDDDLELLRQHALKTKTVKTKKSNDVDDKRTDNKITSEDEDSDTTELRLICLKSALLKKAIEMKRKQKLRKRLSQSSNLPDDINQFILADKINSDNNTDIESVDMDIGSDGDDKLKETEGSGAKTDTQITKTIEKDIPVLMVANQDELEEDEDLLRANLLTSLSKNLPNLVSPNVIKNIASIKDTGSTTPPKQAQATPVPPEKRFIINVESDSEGEHEATKNLTKMHMKLSEQIDFQQKLDSFLKSTRMEVEKTKLPDVVLQPIPLKKNEKYVVKAVKNLPKSEQIEYKNLVKRMAELEKIKQARQSTMNLNNNKPPAPMKDTLKPRNVTINSSNLSAVNSLEEKIKMSRKNIAEESAKMLKLKEEETKLSQKFKIVATELRNIKTAVALNKKQQLSVQNCLSKIRLHHQMLLKSSLTPIHSKSNKSIMHLNHINPRLQKENNPKDRTHPMTTKEIPKEGYKNPTSLKSIKVGITNDLVQTNAEKPKPLVIQHPRLSIETDVKNSKRVVSVPSEESKHKKTKNEPIFENKQHSNQPIVEKGGGKSDNEIRPAKRRDSDDYKSPLDAFGNINWKEDPNAILCPFEVCGDCKDTDCKYLHTNTRSK